MYNLSKAIYEREFSKPLKRAPLILVGGFEAWKKEIGQDGIAGTVVASGSQGGQENGPPPVVDQ